MSLVAVIVALVMAFGAAAAAALIVLPAPSMSLALFAIAAGEKSLFIIAVAVAAAVLALFATRPGTRLASTVVVLLSLAAVVVALVPLAQALRVASEQRVELDFGRYLRSKVDTLGPISAPKTVTYATTTDGRALKMDVYAPAGARLPSSTGNQPTRAVVVAHGGGWSAGEKGDASYASQRLADHGFTVFDVEYRTAPQPNWLTATGDVKCAVGWIKAHPATADWNVDPNRVTLLGRSAGGHLALLAAYAPAEPRLPASCPVRDADLSVESVVAFYAPTDLVWGYAHPARQRVYDSSAKLRQFIGGPPDSTGDLYRLLSPTERATPRSPRTLLIHGGRDQLIGRQHVDMLADKLHAAGVRYDTLIIPYAQHGFDFIFGGLSGQIAETVLLRFLNAARVQEAQREAPPRADEADGGAAEPNGDGNWAGGPEKAADRDSVDAAAPGSARTDTAR